MGAEQALEEKVITTLEPVTGVGNVRASVTVEYDPDALEETRESYDPAQSATLSMERSEQTIGHSRSQPEFQEQRQMPPIPRHFLYIPGRRLSRRHLRLNREPMVYQRRFGTSLKIPERCTGSQLQSWSMIASFKPRAKELPESGSRARPRS